MDYLIDWYEIMVPSGKHETNLKGGLPESGNGVGC